MILLIPVSRFRVSFEKGSGRPYSKLKALILRSVEEGAGTLDELCKCFCIHPRLLIEALVTLTQAGWLAVSSDPGKSFVITVEGRQALSTGEAPLSLQIIPDETYVLMERLTGGIVWYRDVRYVTDRDLESVNEECIRLVPLTSDHDVDASQVQHLLPRGQGEWVRWIGPIDLVGRDFQWLPITVDAATWRIGGLPYAWKQRLQDDLLLEAQRRAPSLHRASRDATWPLSTSERSNEQERTAQLTLSSYVTRDDLLFTAGDHDRHLRHVLDQAASSVFISSAFLAISRLEELRDALTAALVRGVSIDVLWGYAVGKEPTDKNSLNLLTNLATKAKNEAWLGRLRFNRTSSNSHSKLLLWDVSQGVYNACVGSFNWLSTTVPSNVSKRVSDVSVKMGEPGIVAQLCRCAAGLWEGTNEKLSAVPVRWQQAASHADRRAATKTEVDEKCNAHIRIILDRDHELMLRQCLQNAQLRLLVTSHQLAPVASTRLVAGEGRQRGTDFDFAVIYGHTELSTDSVAEIDRCIEGIGGSLQFAQGSHSKVVVSDDTVCVSSYNFLSADPFRVATGARELGLILDGEEPATWVIERLLTLVDESGDKHELNQ